MLFRSKFDRPIIFSEVGYCSSVGANTDPAHCGGSGVVDHQSQVNCFEALFEAWLPESAFAGLHVWAWIAAADGGGEPTGDAGFSPANKPAAELIKSYFTKFSGATK